MKNELKIALSVECPVCHAPVGTRCVVGGVFLGNDGIAVRKNSSHPHKERVVLGSSASINAVLNQTFVSLNIDPTGVSVPPPVPTPDPSKYVTHIALIVDSSRSMFNLAPKTIQVFNAQLDNIQNNARTQKIFVSVYSFDTRVRPISLHGDPAFATRLCDRNYAAVGDSTSLLDAVYHAIQDFNALRVENDPNHSFLLLTITDGEENSSKNIGARDLADILAKKQGSDRWTFTFLVPPNGGRSRRYVQNLGVPDGNIQEWELSARGLDVASVQVSAGMSDYLQRRATGQKSTQTFFASAANLTQTDLNKLSNLSRNFHRWEVNRDGVQIQDFVSSQIGHFMKGHSYYQLMKSEKVQPTKDFLIMHKRTGAIYGGDEARRLLGVARNQYVHVRPGTASDYEIFVRSDSYTRKLPKGSILLYKI